MMTKTITIRVFTNPGTNASALGESHSYAGTAWRNSVDRCDSNGDGRVFIDCDDEEAANHLCEQLEKDDAVCAYDVYSS